MLFVNILIQVVTGLSFDLSSGIQTDTNFLSGIVSFKWFNYPKAYLFLYFVGVVMIGILYYKIRFTYKPLEEVLVQGTQGFEDVKELPKQYPTVQVTPFAEEDYYEGVPGFPVGRLPRNEIEKKLGTFRYIIAREPSHSITLAHTRGGKGIYFSDPLIDILSRAKDIKDRASFLYTGTKGDEPRKWYKLLKSRGYNIRVLNTVDQFYSDPYNPFNTISLYYKMYKKESNAILRNKYLDKANRDLNAVSSMYFEEKPNSNEGFWIKACRSLFKAMALALMDQEIAKGENAKVNGYTIYNTVNEMFSEKITENSYDYLKKISDDPKRIAELVKKYDGRSLLDVYFEEMDRHHPARIHYYGMKASAPAKTTLGNIITHFNGDLEMFLQSGNAKLTAVDDGFTFESVGYDSEAPTAIFVMLSDAEESNNMLGLLYIEQLYQTLIRRAFDELNGQTDRQVHMIIEEAGNIGAIFNLFKKWSASLGRGITWHLVLQDLEQLTELYGQNAKSILVGNTGNLNYIRSGSLDTNKYIAERLGKRPNYSKTRQKGAITLNSTETENSERIELLAPFELENLRAGETVLLRLMHTHDNSGEPIYQVPIKNTYETDTNLIPFYEYRKLETVAWEDIPVNNSFMEIEMDDLLWTLNPEKEKDSQTISKKKTTIKKEKTDPIKDLGVPINKHNEPLKNVEGVAKMFISPDIDPMLTIKERDRSGLSAYKTEKLNEIDRLMTPADYKRRVDDVFTPTTLQTLTMKINAAFIGDKVIRGEYKIIQEEKNIDSLITFIISNGDKELIELFINLITNANRANSD